MAAPEIVGEDATAGVPWGLAYTDALTCLLYTSDAADE